MLGEVLPTLKAGPTADPRAGVGALTLVNAPDMAPQIAFLGKRLLAGCTRILLGGFHLQSEKLPSGIQHIWSF